MRKWTIQNDYIVPRLYRIFITEFDEAFSLLTLERIDRTSGKRSRLFSETYDVAHAHRRSNGSPTIDRQIQSHKEVSRKKGPDDFFGLTGMTDRFKITRQICLIILTSKVLERLEFFVRVRVDRIPRVFLCIDHFEVLFFRPTDGDLSESQCSPVPMASRLARCQKRKSRPHRPAGSGRYW